MTSPPATPGLPLDVIYGPASTQLSITCSFFFFHLMEKLPEKMDDDAEDPIAAAISSRRIPLSRTGKRGKKGLAANPRQLLGMYELDFPAASKIVGDQVIGRLELHDFTDDNDAIVGTITIGSIIYAMCLLAGSRQVLRASVEKMERDSDHVGPQQMIPDTVEPIQCQNVETHIDAFPEELQNVRFGGLEKNSFRNPKFWVQWKGRVGRSVASGRQDTVSQETSLETNIGYLVFSGFRSTVFRGTVSCETLGWDNVVITGRKITSRGSRCPVSWSGLWQDTRSDK
jgi:hypothetical protein